MIPIANPLAGYLASRAEIDEAVRRVLASGRYILGPEVEAFEAEFAAYIGVRFAVGVASGTDALVLALRAAGIGPGDEVVTVSHTAVATVAAIELAGATPVLVDIEPDHYTLDPARLEAAISPRTKAVIPVHLYGQPADLEPILEVSRRHGLRVIEDCAQAHGAAYRGRRVGAWGDLGCFSFYPTKNLGAFGDGGMVVTDDPELAGRLRLLREYGWSERYVSSLPGLNSRLDELQAAVLRVKLRHLEKGNCRRREIAARYSEGLTGTAVEPPRLRPNATHVFHLFVVRSKARDRLRQFLTRRGVGTAVHYPVPVHLQPAYRGRVRVVGPLTETERAAREVVSLPIYPELTDDQVQTVIDSIRAFGGDARD